MRSAVPGAGTQIGVGAVMDFDLFLADLAGHLLLLGDGLRAEPNPFHGNGFGGNHRLLCVQDDLVLLLGDGRSVDRVADGSRR